MENTAYKICPVILSGGSGTRLWPLSRGLHPKQFIEINGESLFEKTLKRLKLLSNLLPCIVVCNEEYRFFAANSLQKQALLNSEDNNKAKIILEPIGKNTAPAVALAAFEALAQNPHQEVLLLVLPSDHLINTEQDFAEAVNLACELSSKGYLTTFGVKACTAETGYGYIKAESKKIAGGFKVNKFIEKPNLKKAEELIKEGCYWNSGMFMFTAALYLEELKKYAPNVYKQCKLAHEHKCSDLDFIRIDEKHFAKSENISIDYAVMEKSTKTAVVPFLGSWADLGSWESFDKNSQHDAEGNAKIGDVLALNCKNSYLHSSSRLIAALGLDNLAVIETADAVLVMPKGHGQDVKVLLEILREQKRSEASTHLLVPRPWGSYECLDFGNRFQVKRIIVKPKASLSMQMHHHRAEHWVVVQGTAKITIAGKEELLSENTSTFIPIGAKHRLENPGLVDLEIIEIQSGSYLGEDDIVRFADDYGR